MGVTKDCAGGGFDHLQFTLAVDGDKHLRAVGTERQAVSA
jgi:hypothetical protein